MGEIVFGLGLTCRSVSNAGRKTALSVLHAFNFEGEGVFSR